MTNSSETECIKQNQLRIGEVARGMLDGSVHYLEGSIELAELRHKIGAYENDPDFFAFVAILSEIDTLPIGLSPQEWSAEMLEQHKTEIQQSIEWAKEFSLTQCQSLADRFS